MILIYFSVFVNWHFPSLYNIENMWRLVPPGAKYKRKEHKEPNMGMENYYF